MSDSQKRPTVGPREGVEVMEGGWHEEARRWRESANIPVLTPITARPVDLNPAAWGEDDEEPTCYVRGCGAIEDLEPAGFPGQSLWVCPDCKASYQHQEALRQEFGAEGSEG